MQMYLLQKKSFIGKKTSKRRDCDDGYERGLAKINYRKKDLKKKGLRLFVEHLNLHFLPPIQEKRPQKEGIATQLLVISFQLHPIGKKTSKRRDCDSIRDFKDQNKKRGDRKKDLKKKGLRLRNSNVPPSLEVVQEKRPQKEGIATCIV